MIDEKLLEEFDKKNIIVVDARSCYIDSSCSIGENTKIMPNNVITKNSVIGKNCVLESNNHIENTIIGDDNSVTNSYMKDSMIGNDNFIGPYARLRSAVIKSHTKVGNFVEIKKSIISDGVKVSHLAYIGDAEIGEDTNIGCGVIFCNYNGRDKNQTIIGKNCFLGSNCNIIAPVEIGDNTFIAAGCTVYKSIDSDKFVISKRDLDIKQDYKKIHIKNPKKEE